MMLSENREVLRKKLEALPPKLRIVFALDCAHHALYRYGGQSESLRAAIDMVWRALSAGDSGLAQEAGIACAMIPDTGLLLDAPGSGALDAGFATVSALKCAARDGDLRCAVLAAEAALLAADFAFGRSDRFSRTTSVPVRKEWARQLEVLEKLARWGAPSITRDEFVRLLVSSPSPPQM
jgi:hypothetical protein